MKNNHHPEGAACIEYVNDLKKEMRDIIRENIVKIGVWMYQTMGYPIEAYIDAINREKMTYGEAMKFISNFRKEYPNILKGSRKLRPIPGYTYTTPPTGTFADQN